MEFVANDKKQVMAKLAALNRTSLVLKGQADAAEAEQEGESLWNKLNVYNQNNRHDN